MADGLRADGTNKAAKGTNYGVAPTYLKLIESRHPCHAYHNQDIVKQCGRLCDLCEQDNRTEEGRS